MVAAPDQSHLACGRAGHRRGLRISFGSALVAVVPAEMLLGELGVGYLTWIEWNNLDIAGILFAILVIGVVGVILDAGFNRLARLVTYPE